MPLRTLARAGDRIALVTRLVVVTAFALNILYPSVFAVGGPPTPLRTVSLVVLAVGVVLWAQSASSSSRSTPRVDHDRP